MTVTTIRPDGIAFNSRVLTVSGAASANAAVSDNSDSSYIQGQADKQYIRFTLGNIGALTGTQRVKSVTPRIRNARDAAGNCSTQDTMTTVNNCTAAHTGSCAPVASYLSTRGLTSIATGIGPIAYVGPCGAAWDQNQVNNLCIQVQWFKVHCGTSSFQRIHELYVDVDVNNQPVITGAPTVTGFTNNATPTVSWVFFDADDDIQASWRVKIFNATTIATPGFNPDTSPADWDSGQQYTTDAQTTATTPLVNGVSYTAYVNAAQAWPGPQGKYWWSGWATSAPFTITFTPPPTPTIQSAAVLTDVNQYRAVLQVFAPVNLLSDENASFEGGTLGNWTALANCTVTNSTTFAADGTHSMRMSSTAGGDMTAICAIDANKQPQVTPGQTYTVVEQFRTGVSARSVNAGARWLDNAGVQIGADVYGSNVTDSSANFNTQAVFTAVAPAGAYQLRPLAKVQATGAGAELHYVDKVQVIAGSSTSWMPGGYQNNLGDLLLEKGEYVLGDRGPADNWFHPQIASCGTTLRTHEFGFAGNPANSADTLQWRFLDKVGGWPDGETPAGMLDYVPGTTVSAYLRFGEWNQQGNNTAFMVPVVQGLVHGFWVWGWTDTGTVNVNATIDWRDINGAIVSSTNGPTVALSTTPQRLLVTGTPPGTAFLATGAVVGPVTPVAGSRWRFTRAGFGLGTIPVDGKPARGVPSGVLASGQPAGLVWTPVRFRDDGETMGTQLVTNFPPARRSGQVELLADYEYAPARPVLYRASISYTTGGATTKSAYAYTVVYGSPPSVPMLRSTTDPTLQIAVNRRKTGQSPVAIVDDATLLHPLGGNAAPVRIRDWVGGEDGEIIAITSTEVQNQRLRRIIRSNDVMQLQWPQGGHTYCVIVDRSVSDYTSSDIDFCDVDGQVQLNIRYSVTILHYLETVMP